MANKYVVGVCGPAGSGKDTAADYLATVGFEKISFALPLKRALTAMFGVDFVNMDRETKEAPMTPLEATPRRLMQTLGTEWGRDLIDRDVWVKALDMYVHQSNKDCFVVPDVRFQNEVGWIREKEGILIYIVRPGADPVEAHASEKDIDPSDADHVIVNSGTIEGLHERVFGILTRGI